MHGAALLLLLPSVLSVMTGGARGQPAPRTSRGAYPCLAAGPWGLVSQRRPRPSRALTLSLRGAGVEGGDGQVRGGDSEDIAALEDLLEQVRRPAPSRVVPRRRGQ